jgi:histidinol-phosphate aminotransferase
MSGLKPIEGIMKIAPYVGGDSKVEGVGNIIKLSSNEAATGPSPKAMDAYRAMADKLHRYPDGGSNELRQSIANMYGLDVNGVICGNGSDEIISSLIHAYCGPGDEVLYSEHGFLMYALGALACGATPVKAPESDYTASVDAILEAVTPRTKIVFLANPNNPTGTYVAATDVERLRAELRDDVMLVIDAAYAEFVSRNDYSAGIELVDVNDNVVMTRTFSKIYGLAALRIGWAYCPVEIANVYHRIRSPFNVNAAAQAAAVAALGDVAHTDMARAHNDTWLPWLNDQFAALGFDVMPSVANFVTVRFGKDEKTGVAAAHAFLKAKGILPRDITAYGLGEWLRFTIGTEAENRAVIDAVREFVEASRA